MFTNLKFCLRQQFQESWRILLDWYEIKLNGINNTHTLKMNYTKQKMKSIKNNKLKSISNNTNANNLFFMWGYIS